MAILRQILDVAAPDADVIRAAAEALRGGELVIFPTDTVYGVGADPQLSDAEQALYSLKRRPRSKPISRLAHSFRALLREGVEIDSGVERLADAFWPGALTMILHGRNGSVAYRVPDHPVALALLEAFGRPLAVTSANPADEPDAVDADEAAAYFDAGVHAILDAGPAPLRVASTVVRVTADGVTVLREGTLSAGEVEQVWRG